MWLAMLKKIKRKQGKAACYSRRVNQKTYGDLKKKMIISFAGMLVGTAVLYFAGLRVHEWLAGSDFFQITDIRINGCEYLTKEDVFKQSGIDIHTNLMALDLKNVERNISGLGWVKNVELERDWPNGLVISVHEREPLAMIASEEGLFYVDSHGSIFSRVQPGDDMDFPVITSGKELAVEREKFETGRVLSSGAREALQFIAYAGKINSILPRQNISQIHVKGNGELVLFLASQPFPVYLNETEIKSQYYRLVRVLDSLYKKKVFSKTAYIKMNYLENTALVGRFDKG